MKKYLKYENFWCRNLVVFLMFFGVQVLIDLLGEHSKNEKPYTISQDFLIMIVFYTSMIFNNLLIVKKFLFKQKYLSYIGFTLVFVLVFSQVFDLFSCEIIDTRNVVDDVFTSFFMTLFGTSIYFVHNWILGNILQTKKELISKEAELNFLKHQVSPHFLFNALNNLYGTSLATPENTSDKILELSNLLRYQIESTKIDMITLKQEMTFVNNYFEYISDKTNNIKTNTIIKGSNDLFMMPPLLLLPLIENSVKYTLEAENPFIEINWEIYQTWVSFTIKNTFLQTGSRIKGTKTGLINLHKRLEILENNYSFTFKIDPENTYQTTLILWK